jgi:ATP-dependent DNA helicase RecQ
MRIRILTLRYSESLGGFDDTPIQDCLRERGALSFREYFFEVNGVPHLACIMIFEEQRVSSELSTVAKDFRNTSDATGRGTTEHAKARRDPTAGLSENHRFLFNTLREWRAERSRDEGVPPYVIFTNKQLIEMVRTSPENVTALGHLDGIGPAKVKRYGAEVLKLLQRGRIKETQAVDSGDQPGSAEGEI